MLIAGPDDMRSRFTGRGGGGASGSGAPALVAWRARTPGDRCARGYEGWMADFDICLLRPLRSGREEARPSDQGNLR